MIQSGAFPSGVPSWVSPLAVGGMPGKGSSVGIISDTVAYQASRQLEVRKRRRATTATAAPKSRAEGSPQTNSEHSDSVQPKSSPLDEIAAVCPGTDEMVSDALTTFNRNRRIQKLNALTRICPQPIHLWLWLGKDYSKLNQTALANYCFEEVLKREPNNEEAKDLLKTLTTELPSAQ